MELEPEPITDEEWTELWDSFDDHLVLARDGSIEVRIGAGTYTITRAEDGRTTVTGDERRQMVRDLRTHLEHLRNSSSS
jgi:hypothetical protein